MFTRHEVLKEIRSKKSSLANEKCSGAKRNQRIFSLSSPCVVHFSAVANIFPHVAGADTVPIHLKLDAVGKMTSIAAHPEYLYCEEFFSF